MLQDADAQGSRPLRYLALGDSYTIGESVAEDERWPNQLDDVLTKNSGKEINTTVLATTGWRTDNLNNAINIAHLEEVYDLVSLLIGVNNQYQGKSADEYAVEFEALLKTSIRLAKGKPENVFVVSIPDYGYTPFGQKNQATISAAIDQFNTINKRISEQYHIKYVNITDISREGISKPDLVASDGLHPSGKMYALWVARIAKVVTLK
jgi:lysophospholipase L1-like esterase